MTLFEQLKTDVITAMRAKDTITRDTLRMLISDIQLEMKKKDLTDSDIIAIITKAVKRRDEAIEAAIKANRSVILNKELIEKNLLMTYLPEQMTEEQVWSAIRITISSTGATSVQDTGKVMKVLMPELRGKFDGKKAKEMVGQQLTEIGEIPTIVALDDANLPKPERQGKRTE